ncbi:MAG: hypothetical protein ABJL99_08745 [Aliishimia sp.]
MHIKFLFALLFNLIAVLTLFSASKLSAGANDPRNATQKISTSIAQAALVAGMAETACFAMTGVDRKRSQDAAREYMDNFSTVLAGLRDGHEWLGLLPETNDVTRQKIDATEDVWRRFKPVVEQIINGDYHSVVVHQLIEQHSVIEAQSDELAEVIVSQYQSDAMTDALRRGLIAAGKHRILSQNVITELCLVMFDVGGPEMKAQLAMHLAEFEAGFIRLSEGAADIPPAPNARVKRNYRTASLFWEKMNPVFKDVISGKPVDVASLKKAMKYNKSVLKQLNQAVEGYLQ